jgi:hypothetical protein
LPLVFFKQPQCFFGYVTTTLLPIAGIIGRSLGHDPAHGCRVDLWASK